MLSLRVEGEQETGSMREITYKITLVVHDDESAPLPGRQLPLFAGDVLVDVKKVEKASAAADPMMKVEPTHPRTRARLDVSTEAQQLAVGLTLDARTAPIAEKLVAIGVLPAEAEQMIQDYGPKRVTEVIDWSNRLALRQDITSRPQLIRSTLARRPRGR